MRPASTCIRRRVNCRDTGGGTDIIAVHDGLPPGLPPVDNDTGWREALDKLAALVENG